MLATGVGGTGEALAEGAGALVADGDDAALAGEWHPVRLVASPEERAALASKALARVSAEFGSERMIERTAALYARVLGGRAPAR